MPAALHRHSGHCRALLPRLRAGLLLPPGLLPHPPSSISNFADLFGEEFRRLEDDVRQQPAAPPVGQPSWQVRASYHGMIADFERRIAELRPACYVASLAVHARATAREQARLQGSAAMHLGLRLRDLVTYGSWSPFTLPKLMARKRAKQSQASALSDEEVCSSIVGSSTKTSASWNERAEAAQELGAGYVQETVLLYLLPACSQGSGF
ncbi:secG [Symbiodinium sp. CCMP2456]|nr:secG [Symbiodinium sp. CCMP2456]